MSHDNEHTSDEPVHEQDTVDDEAEAGAHTREQVAEHMEGNVDAADVALKAADEIAEVQAQLEAERQRVAELENQLLRRAAEFQNYRRRSQEDIAYAADRGRAEVILRMIEVFDDLRRSREAAEEAATREKGGPLYEALKQGLDLVYRKLEDALASFGVEEIEAIGTPFDERLHEAMMQQEVENQEPGTVIDEVQKGYAMGDRVLRHAQVVVAR